MRGEQQPLPQNGEFPAGSPPLARGTGGLSPLLYRGFRITPACAGNSLPGVTPAEHPQDHPRLRGEQTTSPSRYSTSIGSPPLARGTAAGAAKRAAPGGITPACAGNRISVRPVSLFIRDHPRLRGEQLRRTHFSRSARGSPPLARGTAETIDGQETVYGITPACAGNSSLRDKDNRPQ